MHQLETTSARSCSGMTGHVPLSGRRGGSYGYLRALDRGLSPGGFAVFATFALSGPERCSGLPVRRYSAATLQATLGAGYELIKATPETHMTPAGNRQDFIWCLFRKAADGEHP
jgi:hypothetical protein